MSLFDEKFIEKAIVDYLPSGQLQCPKCKGTEFGVIKGTDDGITVIMARCNPCETWFMLEEKFDKEPDTPLDNREKE